MSWIVVGPIIASASFFSFVIGVVMAACHDWEARKRLIKKWELEYDQMKRLKDEAVEDRRAWREFALKEGREPSSGDSDSKL